MKIFPFTPENLVFQHEIIRRRRVEHRHVRGEFRRRRGEHRHVRGEFRRRRVEHRHVHDEFHRRRGEYCVEHLEILHCCGELFNRDNSK